MLRVVRLILCRCISSQVSNFMILSALLLSTMYLTGCGAYAVSPVSGFLHTDVKGPVMATSNTISDGYASGSASATSILGLIAKGDASIETAARNGGITKIYFVDHSSENILGIFATYTVTVYGEPGRPVPGIVYREQGRQLHFKSEKRKQSGDDEREPSFPR